tara:strand:+ start:93 stop:866 length:774 start_codon:yes stop_codon:yes gene_type:complete
MADNITVSYSDGVKGWPSRFSFIPEFLTGLNTYLYSFDGGNLYRHNTNSLRNNYYGVQSKSTITGVFNEQPLEIKLYKTMSFESSAAWECTNLTTDLSTGSMLSSDFEQKEGEWFTFIRQNASTLDLKLRSAHGIGNVVDVISGAPGQNIFEFDVDLGNIISGGDAVYLRTNNQDQFLGTVANSANSIDKVNNKLTVNVTNVIAILPGTFIYYYKNVIAESTGARGYFMEFTLELPLTVTTPVELFSVGSSVMKSYP